MREGAGRRREGAVKVVSIENRRTDFVIVDSVSEQGGGPLASHPVIGLL